MKYPKVHNPDKVGTYPAKVYAGGGYVWDEVLEYRVWCVAHEGDDYFYPFDDYEDALNFSNSRPDAKEPLALILQKEYISEEELGVYNHVKIPRMTEWPVCFLTRPRRNKNTIIDFLSPDAPDNKLDIIRGEV